MAALLTDRDRRRSARRPTRRRQATDDQAEDAQAVLPLDDAAAGDEPAEGDPLAEVFQ